MATAASSTSARVRPDQVLRPRVPAVVAWSVRVAAVYTVVDLLLPQHLRTRRDSEAVQALVVGVALAAAIGAAGAMLLLAGALQRRRRRAWVLMTIVVCVGTAAGISGHRLRVAAVNLALLALLLWARRDFPARSLRPTRRAAVAVLLVMGSVSVVAGLLLVRHTAPDNTLTDQLGQVLLGLLGFTPDLTFRHGGGAGVTEISLNSLGALTALMTLAALLAPVRKAARLGRQDETRLRELLDRFGDRDSLGYFALRRDKSVIFSPSGKAAISYRVIGSVSLASGDPIGDPEAWPGVIRSWLEETERYGWIPGVIGACEDAAEAYRRAGLDALELGDEAVVELAEFRLDGRSMRGVRQAANRVRRAGYRADIARQSTLSPQELAEAISACTALRDGDTERGFSMALGRLGDPADPGLVLVRIRDGQERLVAVLSFVPWGHHGLSLDVMRRSRDSENGTVEFAVTELIGWAQEQGLHRLSLNFAVFRSVFERGGRIGAGPVLRAWRRLLLFASTWWQIESLYRANAKYGPSWNPRFICFPKAADLPRVSIAALQAEAFLQRPRLLWLLGG
ncbi:MAG TPA: phosphatidylglycerol lysyltransferase domain-containing protein [Kineosporiaceae bacterium]|nr:phosphatidylglycerol lysyltransferase domain-containing protein [Kineosporiaceae bacterium]